MVKTRKVIQTIKNGGEHLNLNSVHLDIRKSTKNNPKKKQFRRIKSDTRGPRRKQNQST